MNSINYSLRLLFAGALALFSNVVLASGLSILVYHQIRTDDNGPPDSATAISLERFERQMKYLHEQGYTTLNSDEVADYVAGRRSFNGKKIIAIHMDDGWKSGLLALPALDRYAFRASFWIISGTGIGSPHMDWEDVEAIARNPRYEVMSHTLTHPWKDGDTLVDWVNGRTPGKGVLQARRELLESRRLLAEKLQKPVKYLAWPGGFYDETLIGLATESGYAALFTIDDGTNRSGGDLRRIRRTMVHGGCDDRVFAQIVADGRYEYCPTSVNSNR